ncbi:putative ribonuclease H-like domain-containing protein [Tanacetum coccineum]
MDNVRQRGSYSPIKRSYYIKPAFRPKYLKQDVKTFGVQNMTTVGSKAVVNIGKGKMDTDLKKLRWVWRPKGNYVDHMFKDSGSFMLKKGNPEILLQGYAVVDSGCSSHMTGNKAYLSDYEDYNGGFVAFRSDPKGGKITGKGKIRTANLDFGDVYFVDELKFNLFSVSQMCDKKNSVLFTETECLILSPSFKLLDESQVVLRDPRKDDVYSLDLKNIIPSGGITCLYVNATADESKLWHRRLGHVNFKNINKLVKGHLVRGSHSKVFVNDHTCVACKKGKQHKVSCKAKLERIIKKPLELLHMNLFGPVSVESINNMVATTPRAGVNGNIKVVFPRSFPILHMLNAYAFVAKNLIVDNMKGSFHVREDSGDHNLEIDLSHDGAIDFPFAVLGCSKDFCSIANSRTLCRSEGARDKFLIHSGIQTWFSSLKLWHDDFLVEERLVWLEVEGVPIHAWDNVVF